MVQWMLLNIGLKRIVYVGLVFGAITAGWVLIQRIQDSGKAELKIEQLETNIRVRNQIDEGVRTSPRDVDSALRLLELRQSTRD